VKRARTCAGEDASLDGLEPVAAGPGAGGEALGAEAARLAGNLRRLASDLEQVAAKHRAGEAGFLAEAEAAVDDLLPSPGTLEGLAEDVRAARLTAAAEVATNAQLVERIRDAIETRTALAAEVEELRARGRTFRSLAGELRADHLVAFLQSEALQVLAAAGSERLATLSDGRYRLVCEDDEFSVVDTWNGDERRSVRTLSGGETFLASLALALALSEQVRSLSVTERARLDSLFLDEGFGTLDPESLRVVVEAIEQLGGDGRLVGVITHVAELAEQFPRIQVEKSPRGSRLRLEV
jgi:exonuclease SbcC